MHRPALFNHFRKFVCIKLISAGGDSSAWRPSPLSPTQSFQRPHEVARSAAVHEKRSFTQR
jgi:hypothetical protein